MPLYHNSTLWLGCSNPVFIKKANKRKPSETGLSLSDSQAFHYHGSQFVCACMYMWKTEHTFCTLQIIRTRTRVILNKLNPIYGIFYPITSFKILQLIFLFFPPAFSPSLKIRWCLNTLPSTKLKGTRATQLKALLFRQIENNTPFFVLRFCFSYFDLFKESHHHHHLHSSSNCASGSEIKATMWDCEV